MNAREIFKNWGWSLLGLVLGFVIFIFLSNVLWWPLSLINIPVLIIFFASSWSRRLWFWSGYLFSQLIFLGASFFPPAIFSFVALFFWYKIRHYRATRSFLVSALILWLLLKISFFSGYYFFSGNFYLLLWSSLVLELAVYILCLLLVRRLFFRNK